MDKGIRLILFDLDDTLLQSDQTVSKTSKAAIKKCHDQGIRIGYITARSPRKTGIFLEGLPFDCSAFYNGAIIKVKDEVIGSCGIDHKLGLDFIRSLKNDYADISITAYMEPLCYKNNEVRIALTQEVTELDLFRLPPYEFQRIRVFPGEGCNLDLSEYNTENMQLTYSRHGSVMVSNEKACKRNAVDRIKDYLRIDQSQILSFGDDLNDIGMFEASGTGVAMANAVPELKEIADYITLSNDEDGIADYLNKYVL